MAAIWGNTPMVELTKYKHNNVRIFAKLEGISMGGSIKDRIGMWFVHNAHSSGILEKNKILIEATSGNTGIGLSLACIQYGYRCKLLVPKITAKQKVLTMKAYGADVELIDGDIDECIGLVEVMSNKSDKYVWLNQYDNMMSIDCHYNTTAPEIYNWMDDYYSFCDWNTLSLEEHHNILVCGMGTTGTIMGLSFYLKPKGWKIIGVIPQWHSHLEGLKNLEIQRVPQIFNKKMIDKQFAISDNEAKSMCQELARVEGLLVGPSSGAAMCGALMAANEQHWKKKTNIVVIFPDRGDRYLC